MPVDLVEAAEVALGPAAQAEDRATARGRRLADDRGLGLVLGLLVKLDVLDRIVARRLVDRVGVVLPHQRQLESHQREVNDGPRAGATSASVARL